MDNALVVAVSISGLVGGRLGEDVASWKSAPMLDVMLVDVWAKLKELAAHKSDRQGDLVAGHCCGGLRPPIWPRCKQRGLNHMTAKLVLHISNLEKS